jgi:hypothetical protein
MAGLPMCVENRVCYLWNLWVGGVLLCRKKRRKGVALISKLDASVWDDKTDNRLGMTDKINTLIK